MALISVFVRIGSLSKESSIVRAAPDGRASGKTQSGPLVLNAIGAGT
jgi:hypothetical protein